MAAARARRRAKQGASDRRWLHGLVCGAILMLAPPTAVLAVALLAPGLLAWCLEGDRRRPVARTMLLCGLAASVQPIRLFWGSGGGLEAAFGLALDLSVADPAWAAASGGWLLAQLVPLVIQLILQGGDHARRARLRRNRQALAEEWGLPGEPA
jgi:hypothetical protein